MRVAEADVTQAEVERRSLVAKISYEARSDCSARFSVGFIDESGYEVGASLSPPFRVRSEAGSVRWDIPELPLRPGIYFPVVSVLSAEGAILDRWKLDRPVVFDMNGSADVERNWDPRSSGGHGVMRITRALVRGCVSGAIPTPTKGPFIAACRDLDHC